MPQFQPVRQPRPRGADNAKAVGWGCGCLTLGLVLLGGCGAVLGTAGGDDSRDTAKPVASASSASSASPTPSGKRAKPSKPASPSPTRTTAALPDFTGKGLQAAQDAAQELGYHVLDSRDLTGQERLQVWDRNWKVCGQSPKPGRRPVDQEVTFMVVQLGESCSDRGPQQPADDVPASDDDSVSSGGGASSGAGGGGSATSGTSGGADAPPVSYANCDAVRAANAAPLHANEPGYGRHLDRDGDGLACDT